MLQIVFNHNLAQADASTQITVVEGANTLATGGTTKVAAGQTSSPEKVSTGKRYDVRAVYDSNSKLITTMVL